MSSSASGLCNRASVGLLAAAVLGGIALRSYLNSTPNSAEKKSKVTEEKPRPTVESTVAEAAKNPEQVAFSFEFFPAKTLKGMVTLLNRMWRMSKQGPMFMDITWGAGGSTSASTLAIATTAQRLLGLPLNMHLTCTNMPAKLIHEALEECEKNGVNNICALRGDPPAGQDDWKAIETGFSCALDLVKFIRKSGKDFCLSVAGYPEGHPNVIKEVTDTSGLSETELGRLVRQDGKMYVCNDADFEKEIAYLKEKVDAGAQAIISQLFYDVETFLAFVNKCRSVGINVPILPGIMPIAQKRGFKRMIGFCKTRIPADLMESVEAAETDEDVAAIGTEWVTAMCRTLLGSKKITALHFYTLNKEKPTYDILEALGVSLVDSDATYASEKEDIASQVQTAVTTLLGATLPA